MKNKVAFFIILLICVVSLVILIFLYSQKTLSSKDYYAVFIDSGDVYFGELSKFPYLSLSNIWYLQKDESSKEIGLAKFSESLWGPEDKIKLNSDKIVWISKLSKDSPVISAINGRAEKFNQSLNKQEKAQENPAPQAQVPGVPFMNSGQ